MGFAFKSKPSKPARGGNTKMFGKQKSGTRVSGTTSPGGGGAAKNAKFAAGGPTKMFGKQTVKMAKGC
jgi:hypothetical protein